MAPSPSKPIALSGIAARGRAFRQVLLRLTLVYMRNRKRISYAVYVTLFLALVHRIRNTIVDHKGAQAREAEKRAAKAKTTAIPSDGEAEEGQKKVALNREFFRSLGHLLRIVVPGWKTRETQFLVSHSFFLVMRTLISLKVAAMDGAIVKALIKGNGREFLKRIMWWMIIAVPATFTNSMLAYHQSELSLRYRVRLTEYIHEKYLSKLTFYGISALDDRIKNADQLIAVDVTKFSNHLAELYSNLAKPVLDMVSFSPFSKDFPSAMHL